MRSGALISVVNRTLNGLTTTVMGLLVLDVTWQVVSRYLLRSPSAWTEELAGFLLIWVGMLGAAIAHREKAHLGIDFLVTKFSRRGRDMIRVVVSFLTFFFALGVLTTGGLQLVRNTLASHQVSPALGIPMGYVYLAVPVSGLFMAIYSLQHAYAHYAHLLRNEE